jgi:hypothetical protein
VILALSQVDRAAIAALFMKPASRGGSPEILLAQDDLETLLGIAEFMGQAEVSTATMSTEPVDVDIPDEHVPVLRQMLGWPGQQPNAARIVAKILRQLPKP